MDELFGAIGLLFVDPKILLFIGVVFLIGFSGFKIGEYAVYNEAKSLGLIEYCSNDGKRIWKGQSCDIKE